MATSGTTAFTLDFTEVAEEAWERAGKELRSGYQLRTARRSMNLLTLEWANRGINMWTISEGTVSLVSGTGQYSLPTDTIDLLEALIRTDAGDTSAQADLSVTRISVSTYATIPNKLLTGRPTQMWVERRQGTPRVNLWPVPDSNDYTLKYYYLRRIEDAGNGVENPDIPFRFYPALVAGLAYYLAMKTPDLAPRVQLLKADYDEQFALAAEEDREKTPLRLVPGA